MTKARFGLRTTACTVRPAAWRTIVSTTSSSSGSSGKRSVALLRVHLDRQVGVLTFLYRGSLRSGQARCIGDEILLSGGDLWECDGAVGIGGQRRDTHIDQCPADGGAVALAHAVDSYGTEHLDADGV